MAHVSLSASMLKLFICAAMPRGVLLSFGSAQAAAWLGQRMLRMVSPVRFTQFVLLMLFLMGCQLLVDGLRAAA